MMLESERAEIWRKDVYDAAIKKQARIAALTDAHRIAQDVMRLSADTGSTGAAFGAKVVRDRIQSLIEEASI